MPPNSPSVPGLFPWHSFISKSGRLLHISYPYGLRGDFLSDHRGILYRGHIQTHGTSNSHGLVSLRNSDRPGTGPISRWYHRDLQILARHFLPPNRARRSCTGGGLLPAPRDRAPQEIRRPGRPPLQEESLRALEHDEPLACGTIVPIPQPHRGVPRVFLSRLEHVLALDPYPLRSQPSLPPHHAHPVWPLLPRTGLRISTGDLLRRALRRPHHDQVASETQRDARARGPPALCGALPRHRHPRLHVDLRLVRREALRRHPATRHHDVSAGRGAAVLLPKPEHVLSGCDAEE